MLLLGLYIIVLYIVHCHVERLHSCVLYWGIVGGLRCPVHFKYTSIYTRAFGAVFLDGAFCESPTYK